MHATGYVGERPADDALAALDAEEHRSSVCVGSFQEKPPS